MGGVASNANLLSWLRHGRSQKMATGKDVGGVDAGPTILAAASKTALRWPWP